MYKLINPSVLQGLSRKYPSILNISRTVTNNLPFNIDFRFGKSQKSQGAKSRLGGG